MTRKQMTWQRRRITRRYLAHRSRGVTTLHHYERISSRDLGWHRREKEEEDAEQKVKDAVPLIMAKQHVTPRERCARCLQVIRCCCLVICLHVMHFISCHHVHRICIHVRLMHPSIFPVVRFVIRRSYVLRSPLLPLFMCGC